MTDFEKAYQSLNTAQKRAVEAIEGPVMVVAGPGTGKTQVLALRIAHILQKTDVGADSVLCLTFTRSGVLAMRSRLEGYIGGTARDVHISTFHSFAGDIVEKYYSVLDFDIAPVPLDDNQAVLIVDGLFHSDTPSMAATSLPPINTVRPIGSGCISPHDRFEQAF
jgi:superfamily I DNA/RNA helicase